MIGVFPTARCGGDSNCSPATVLRRRIGGCGGAWVLREARAELKAGSERAEEVWRGGPAVASGSPELRRRVGGALEPGVRNRGV